MASDGNTVLENISLDVRFEILQGSTTGEMVWTETQTGITTNDYGLFSINVGSDTEISIDWNNGPYFLKVEVDLGNGFQEFGNSELLSVPYALNTKSVSSLENLDIRGPEDMNPDSALFEVKRNDGQTIFAVYNSGSYNVMVGNNTGLSNLSGMNNVYLGTSAGMLNNGNSNVFIGNNAGRNASDISGQLFIDNSSTDMPLIYGNFNTDFFRINGTLEVTEEIIPSDIRLKENIVQLDQVLPKLAQLHGIYFDWKKIDGLNIKLNDRRQIGVIAQEVEQFFPELVLENEFGYKGVDYSKLTPILIEAVNEQQEIIEQKDRRIDELEKRIEKIEAYLGQMGMRVTKMEC